MDIPLTSQPRGRGFRIPAAPARGHSRNKQWLAPGQEPRGGLSSAVAASNGEVGGGSANASDGARWERGGGPWRGGVRARGRGLGRGQYSNASRQPNQQHTVLSTYEELAAAEPPDTVDDEPVLETQEERDTFYQELVAAREVERQHAIATGKMDDPNVAKRLEDAITMVGTCVDMCPRFERYQRERQHQLDRWELIPGTKRVDHKRAVKRYQRAAGDRVIPSDLRPPPILKKTLDYLFHTLLPSAPFPATAFFIRDRSRAVRNDFTIQYETGPLAVECHERCARFHAVSMHLMVGRVDFDLSMEVVGLKNTLQSLKEFYDDRQGDFPMPHELELRIYHLLPQHISSNPVFLLVTKFRSQVQVASPVITRKSELKVDEKAMVVFREMVVALKEYYSKGGDGTVGRQGERRSRRVMYLVACIMEGVFGQGVVDAVEEIKGDLTIQDIIDGNDGFDDDRGTGVVGFEAPDVEEIGMEGEEGDPEDGQAEEIEEHAEEPTVVPTWGMTSAPFPATNQPQQQPIRSAFSNLTSTSPFGGANSAFGITFPVSASPHTTSTFPHPTPSQPPQSNFFGQPAQKTQATAKFGAPLGGYAPSTVILNTDKFSLPTLPSTPFSVSTAPQKSTPPRPPGLNPTAPVFTPPSIAAWNSTATSSSSTPPFAAFPPSISPTQQPRLTETKNSLAAAPPLGSTPTLPATAFSQSNDNLNSGLGALPTLPANIFAPVSSANASTSSTLNVSATNGQTVTTNGDTEPHLVDRKQTLWDLPSTTPASIADIHSLVPPKTTDLPNITTNGLSYTPPPLNKPAPLTLPPTPTARWFDPSSSNGIVKSPESSIFLSSPTKPQDPSLALRKQSLGLVNLQIPGVSSNAEILSPLTLGTPRVGFPRPPGTAQSSPTPAGPVASTSRPLLTGADDSLEGTNATPVSSPEKGKARATDGDVDGETKEPTYAEMKASALNFARRGSVVKRYFGVWKKKIEDTIEWEEACRRSDAYRAEAEKRRLSNSVTRSREANGGVKRRRLSDGANVSTARSAQKRRRPRGSAQYAVPVTDEELVRRLKENQEEQQRRWAQGSFLSTVRATLLSRLSKSDIHDSRYEYPQEWSIWLSLNSENDGTAIWLERKFDVPKSGGWVSESVFSIPLDHKNASQNPALIDTGSPGLLVFERTPLDDVDDPLEKKYRVLDDCTRLRGVIDRLRLVPTARYTPALLVMTWTDVDGPDAEPDFGDMVRTLLDEQIIGSAQNAVISAKETDWDTRFAEALAHTKLDLLDKSAVHLTWQDLCNIFLTSFKTHASDWLDSCWTDDQFDWSRYGNAMRSIEQLQAALAREIFGLLGRGSDLQLDLPHSDLETPTYATGPFLDSYLNQTVARIEGVLGPIAPSYSLSREYLGSSKHRFEDDLQAASERLRKMAALALSSRSAQKRRAEEGSDVGSPTSTTKRLKVSPVPTLSDHTTELNGDMDHDMDGFLTPPPLSTAPSTAARRTQTAFPGLYCYMNMFESIHNSVDVGRVANSVSRSESNQSSWGFVSPAADLRQRKRRHETLCVASLLYIKNAEIPAFGKRSKGIFSSTTRDNGPDYLPRSFLDCKYGSVFETFQIPKASLRVWHNEINGTRRTSSSSVWMSAYSRTTHTRYTSLTCLSNTDQTVHCPQFGATQTWSKVHQVNSALRLRGYGSSAQIGCLSEWYVHYGELAIHALFQGTSTRPVSIQPPQIEALVSCVVLGLLALFQIRHGDKCYVFDADFGDRYTITERTSLVDCEKEHAPRYRRQGIVVFQAQSRVSGVSFQGSSVRREVGTMARIGRIVAETALEQPLPTRRHSPLRMAGDCTDASSTTTPSMLSAPIFLLVSSLAASAAANTLTARSAFSPMSDLHRRGLTGQNIAFACFGGGGDCQCPLDTFGDSGVLINVYPGFQCAFPSGACTWDDVTGALSNTQQTNCPTSATCSTSGGCTCPHDLNGDTGVLINQFTGYQCAYPHGACTWDFDGVLQNTAQTNCQTQAKCVQSGTDH
ncbi:hypothetical protein BDY19DRAFT_908043 [Irpex rosettiformis]|uniref:Uncharacterized protein n=1 Tax=Irpex rosettiformis TaxID=378272 RepID=A0ACB8TYA8_9APHY|nr:hypothetical protein BDY19DRAFT_908043 [Irpex rosettiformis]